MSTSPYYATTQHTFRQAIIYLLENEYKLVGSGTFSGPGRTTAVFVSAVAPDEIISPMLESTPEPTEEPTAPASTATPEPPPPPQPTTTGGLLPLIGLLGAALLGGGIFFWQKRKRS